MQAIVRTLAVVSLAFLGAAVPVSAEIHELAFATLAQYRAFDTRSGAPVARLADGSYAVVWNEAFQDARLQWVRPDGSLALASGGLPLGKSFNSSPPVVAAHPVAGAFVALAAQVEHGSRILVQSFDGNASPRWQTGGVAALDSPGIEYQTAPQLLASADGGVFVCFLRAATTASSAATVCQRLDADGRPLWPGGRVAEAKPGFRSDTPILISDGKGGILVFWSTPVRTSTVIPQAGDGPTNPIYLKGQRFGPDGSPLWGPAGKVLHLTSWWEPVFDFIRPLAVPDGQGGAILAFPDWREQAHPPLVLGVMAQRVDRNGKPLWGPGVTLERSTNYPKLDSLTAHPNGGAVVVLQEAQGNSRFRLVLFRLGPGGKPRQPANGVVLSVPDRIQQDYGSQGSFDGGRLRILWTSQGIFNAFTAQVRIAVFEPDGRRLTAPGAAPLMPGDAQGGHFFAGFAFDAARNQGMAIWNDYSIPDFLTGPAGALFGGDAGVP